MTEAQLATQLVANGIGSTAHHATIKKAVAEITGEKPSKDDYQRIKTLLEQVKQEPETEVKTLLQWQAEDPEKWGKVLRIVEASETGKPYRVVIACEEQGDDCKGEREIATQDLFQVRNCRPCQKVVARRRRSERRKEKRAAEKATAAAKGAR